MEPEKLFNTARKIARLGDSKPPRFFYEQIVSNKRFSLYFKNLSGKEVIYLSFMSSQISMGKKPEELLDLYKNLEKNLFVFSLISIEGEQSIKTCDWCGGDGELECGDCYGDGEVECDECYGSGEIGGDECNKCGGDGTIRCPECGGSGNIECDNCDGDGEIYMEGYVPITVTEYVSYDAELFNILEIQEEMSEVPLSLEDKAISSELTFSFDYEFTDSDQFPGDVSGDDVFFGEIFLRPVLFRKANGYVDSELKSWKTN